MSLTDVNRQKYTAALEQLEAEQKRRDDERVASGTAVRHPHYVVVVHGDEETTAATEQARARKLADLRAQGIIYDEILEIRTGVPRRRDCDKYQAQPEPTPSHYVPDRYAKERAEQAARAASRDGAGLMEPPEPVT
jgi:hypothetical protein